MTTFRLAWPSPPLSENQRLHWATRARIVRNVRLTGRLLTRGMGSQRRVEVTLVWYVPDRRRRDEDNLTPTLKALCDGIVDAGIVPDDTAQFMVKNMPRVIVIPGTIPRMELVVTPIT